MVKNIGLLDQNFHKKIIKKYECFRTRSFSRILVLPVSAISKDIFSRVFPGLLKLVYAIPSVMLTKRIQLLKQILRLPELSLSFSSGVSLYFHLRQISFLFKPRVSLGFSMFVPLALTYTLPTAKVPITAPTVATLTSYLVGAGLPELKSGSFKLAHSGIETTVHSGTKTEKYGVTELEPRLSIKRSIRLHLNAPHARKIITPSAARVASSIREVKKRILEKEDGVLQIVSWQIVNLQHAGIKPDQGTKPDPEQAQAISQTVHQIHVLKSDKYTPNLYESKRAEPLKFSFARKFGITRKLLLSQKVPELPELSKSKQLELKSERMGKDITDHILRTEFLSEKLKTHKFFEAKQQSKPETIEHFREFSEFIPKTLVKETKERILEKEIRTETPQINLGELAEQIYRLIEKRIRIERERRGLLC